MAGTMVRIVETIGALGDAEAHQKAVAQVVANVLAGSLCTHSATTTLLQVDASQILRVTTLVFGGHN